MLNTICHRCREEIPAERLSQSTVICPHCGADAGQTERRFLLSLKRSIRVGTILGSLAIIGLFIHAVNWNEDSLRIVPLKVKQYAGISTTSDLNAVAEICERQNKSQCVERAFDQISKINPSDQANLVRLGKVLYFNGKKDHALKVYSNYFTNGGIDTDAAHIYARVLAESGNVLKSIEYFNYVLQQKPDTLQITVTTDFVNMLMKNNKLNMARKIIKKTQKMGSNTSYFMNYELEQIEKQLKSRRS